MAAAVAFTSGTTYTVPSNFLNNSTAVLWIWYSGGGGGNATSLWSGTAGYGGAGGNGGNIYLIDALNLTVGGSYGVGIGANAGPGAGVNASSFYIWPQSGYSGANPGGAGGSGGYNICGGGGGAANPGGGGGNGATANVLNPAAAGGAAGPGSGSWPSYGGAGGSSGTFGNNGNNGNSYGGGGGGANVNPSVFASGAIGIQGIVYLWYNTVTPATISSVSPSSTAYQNNGVGVTLGGSMFTTVYAVNIQDLYTGTLYGCNFDVESDSVIFVVPPAVPQHPAYNPNVFIYNQAGEAAFSNLWTLYPNIPIVSSVTGPSYDNGANQVDLNGEFFTTLSTVEVLGAGVLSKVPAGTAGPGVWWFGNDSIIGMYLPAIAPQGALDLTLEVVNSSGAATITVEYIPSPPTFTAISTSTGDESGGYQITITGSGFTTTESVYFGSAICPSFTVNSDTSITVTVPAFNGASSYGGGQVGIALVNPTASVSGFVFTYTFSGYPALNAAHGFV